MLFGNVMTYNDSGRSKDVMRAVLKVLCNEPGPVPSSIIRRRAEDYLKGTIAISGNDISGLIEHLYERGLVTVKETSGDPFPTKQYAITYAGRNYKI